MKYLSYIWMMIVSATLVILLSLSSCNHQNLPETMSMGTPKVTASPSPKQNNTNAVTPNATIKIANFKYQPANLTINAGETVQFVNKDEEPHTVTSRDGSFDSKALDTDQTWTSTFTKPGTFPYICSIHPFMKGTITVAPKRNTP